MKDVRDLVRAHIAEQLSMERENNLKLIKKDIEEGLFGGKYCNDGATTYYIVGATSTDEDYYYVGIAKDRSIHFISAVAWLQVTEEEIDNNFSVLRYLIKNEPETIVADIKRYIDSTRADVLFTKINVNGI